MNVKRKQLAQRNRALEETRNALIEILGGEPGVSQLWAWEVSDIILGMIRKNQIPHLTFDPHGQEPQEKEENEPSSPVVESFENFFYQ